MTLQQPEVSPSQAGIGARLARASLWSIAGKIGSKCFDLMSLVVLTQLLTPADFGLVAKAMSVILILEAVTALPVAQPILRIKNPEKTVFDTAFTLVMLRSLILFGAILAIAWPLAAYFREPRLPGLLIILSLAPILRGAVSPRMAEFMREYNFRPEAYADLLSKFASFVIVVSLAYATASYWALVAGTVVTTLVLFAYTYAVAPYRPALSLKYWHSFADIVGWNTLVQILQTLNWQIDALLLGRALPTSLFGQYAIGRNLNDIPQQAISVPLTRPMMTSFSDAGTDGRRCDLWLKFSNSVLYVMGPILLTMAVLAEATVQILLGSQWQDAAAILFGLSLASMVGLPGVPLNMLAVAMHKSRMMAMRTAVHLAVAFPAVSAGLWFGGVSGVLIAKAGSALVMAIVSMLFVRRLIGLPVYDQLHSLIRSFAGLLLMCAVLYLLRPVMIGPLDSTPRWLLGGQALAVFAIGGAGYVLTTCLLWLLQGRPPAIEALILNRSNAIKRRIGQ
jgi:O-antigen/teichoic acid export membrane protein